MKTLKHWLRAGESQLWGNVGLRIAQSFIGSDARTGSENTEWHECKFDKI